MPGKSGIPAKNASTTNQRMKKKYTRTHARAQVRPASASLRAQDWFGEIVEAYGDLRDGLLC